MRDVIGIVVDLVNELHDIADKNRLSIRVSNLGEKEVNVFPVGDFFNNFDVFDIEELGDRRFPFRVSTVVDDVIFFVLLSQEEYTKFVLKTA